MPGARAETMVIMFHSHTTPGVQRSQSQVLFPLVSQQLCEVDVAGLVTVADVETEAM